MANQRFGKELDPGQDHVVRRADNKVYMGIEGGAGNDLIHICFRDIRGGVISKKDQKEKLKFYPGINKSDAILRCLLLNDSFKLINIHRYNVRLAVYLARRRIVNWANGKEVVERPDEDRVAELWQDYDLSCDVVDFEDLGMRESHATRLRGISRTGVLRILLDADMPTGYAQAHCLFLSLFLMHRKAYSGLWNCYSFFFFSGEGAFGSIWRFIGTSMGAG